jgi:hypothetical protein
MQEDIEKKKGMPGWGIALIIIGIFLLVILVVMIIIGALAYFYMGNPVENSGTAAISAPFYISDWKISSIGVSLIVENRGAEQIILNDLKVSNCESKSYQIGVGLQPGASREFNFDCRLNFGDNFNGNIIFQYSTQSSPISRTSTGQIRGTVN